MDREAAAAVNSFATWPVVDDDGTACMDCDRVLPLGTPYSARLVAVSDRIGPISELVCVYCAVGPVVFADELPMTL